MDEFLKENYSLITSLVEFTAALTGLVLYNKYKSTPVRFIIYFLIYAFFVDLIGGYPTILKKIGYFHLVENTIIEKNYWWYTIFWWIGLSSIMFFVNYKIVGSAKLKKILKYGFALYLIQVILFVIFRFENLFGPERFISISSLWMVALSIIVYFFDILNSERIIIFYKSVYFYFNAVFLLWILIIIPMEFFEAYNIKEDWSYVLLKWKIYLSLNFFLYMTLSLALIFCKVRKS